MRLRQGYIKDGVGYIPLTQGKWALCDAHNFHWLSQWNWYALKDAKTGKWYAARARAVRLSNGRHGKPTMHRVILGVTDPKIEVDHKDRENTLDNREENLRIATHAQNGRNRGKPCNNTSGFKGTVVHLGGYQAQIYHENKTIYLGFFKTPVEAAAAYNFAAKRLHGEFAVLNDLSQVTEAQVGGEQNATS